MNIVFDIETTGLLDSSSLDYSEYPIKLKPYFKVHCIVFKSLDTGKVVRLYGSQLTKKNVDKLLSRATTLIAHNGIGYDLPVLSLYFDVDYYIGTSSSDPSTVNGRQCEITDTAIVSRMLWPDRPSGHSLKEWGKRLGLLKGDYGQQEDAWSEFNQDMLEYCEQDVDVTEAVYDALMEEWGEWDWSRAFYMEQAIAELTFRQEHFGFGFDKEKALVALEDLNSKMADIEARVEPQLPEKPLSKTNLNKFVPPKVQIKKDGALSASMKRFLDRVNGEVKEDDYGVRTVYVEGRAYELPMPNEPVRTSEPMTLANQSEMKQYLVRLGWNPTVWTENDLTTDSKKQAKTDEKYQQSVVRYCEETAHSAFKKFRLLHRKVKTVNELYKELMSANRSRPVRVISAPKYTVDNDKTVCPNLEKLGSKVDFVKDVVDWLTYRHRRNSILSPNGTGFLAQPRIDIDGRIQTPAITCGAASSRYRHSVCVNIPRPSSMYGAPLRDMFKAADGYYQIGCDAAGLEARVEAHYTRPYTGGEQYTKSLLSEKPNDVHTVTAHKMGITRDEAKTLKYSISYGAQPPKVAKQMGWTQNHAKQVFEDFWNAALPLKLLKERLTYYWKTKGQKKFIKGIDGRQLMVRSEHSLVNLLFQSCGVIIMKQAAVMLDRWMNQEGYLFNPFKDSSFQGKAAQMQHYHK